MTDGTNQLLAALSPTSLAKLLPHLHSIALPRGYKLSRPKVACVEVVFPDSGVASIVYTADAAWQDVGLIGREGAAGLSTLLTSRPQMYLTVMQIAGHGRWIEASSLHSMFEADRELRELLLAYVQTSMNQLSCTAIANVRCNTLQRLSRYLLMIQDRTKLDDVELSHEYLAAMLGVGRAGVTVALQNMKQLGLISTCRKRVTILDREGLVSAVGDYYGMPEAEYVSVMNAWAHRHQAF